MQALLKFLAENGYPVVFAWVFLEQLGLPVPALPLLLAAGALAGAGKLNAAAVLGVAVLAALAGDAVWYWLGRRRGSKVLSFLCRVSLEPDSCVRQSETFFQKNGVSSLLVAKFLPGVNTLSPPMAGILGWSFPRFLVFDGLGALLWAGSGVGLGLIFSDQLEYIAETLSRFGSLVGVLAGTALAAYIGWKYWQRRKFLQSLRTAQITPDELYELMQAGGEPVVIDLRLGSNHDGTIEVIPGSLRMSLDEVEHRHGEIPRDREIVFYCACPNEASSARAALILKRRGVHRVRPLTGGFDAWVERSLPLETMRDERVITS